MIELINSKDKIIRVNHKTGYAKYEWTVESFNRRTGNKCKDFRPNRMTNEVV